jgi:uncharacterized protein with GYD domain
VAKPNWLKMFGREGLESLIPHWDAIHNNAEAEAAVGSRFVTLMTAMGRFDLSANAAASAGNAELDMRIAAVSAGALETAAPSDTSAHDAIASLLGLGGPADAAGPVPADAETPAAPRTATIHFDGVGQLAFSGSAAAPFAADHNAPGNYVVAFDDNFQNGLVYNASTKELLPGGPGDWPQLGAGSNDAIELGGDFSAGTMLPAASMGIDIIVARAGNNFNLIASDDHVAPGATLTVNAMPLGDDNNMIFDGSAETDGRFLFFGSQSNDVFLGGAGDDRLAGLGGADMLSGGGGNDIFVYTGADESSSTGYDTLAGFDAAHDKIDLPGGVSGWATPVQSGNLSQGSFDTDLSALLGGLGATQAVWIETTGGDLAGHIFLVVDGNGIAGYQEGEDFVFAVTGTPLPDLTIHTDIFL